MSGEISVDVGTFNLVTARRGADNNIEYKKEINAFLEIPLANRYMFNMLKKAGLPLIEKNDMAMLCGEAALNMAYSMNQLQLRRPMSSGCLNPKEKEAFFVMGIMLHSLIGRTSVDKATVYYTVPANGVNEFSDAEYHQKILDSIFKKYNVDNKVLNAFPINEALCIVFAELESKQYTGIACSFGAGMTNVCHAIYGTPVFAFSIVNSGDFIDEMSARATNENVAVINREKMKIDLTKQATNMIDRSIQAQYRIMLEKTVAGIKKGITENRAKFSSDPIDIILSGGTATPNGFEDWFKEILAESKIDINVGSIRKPADNLYTVARGALLAAENSNIN